VVTASAAVTDARSQLEDLKEELIIAEQVREQKENVDPR
jgi:hypothetical protein